MNNSLQLVFLQPLLISFCTWNTQWAMHRNNREDPVHCGWLLVTWEPMKLNVHGISPNQ